MTKQHSQNEAKDLVETVTFYASTGDIALEHMVRRGHFDMKVKHFHPEYEIFYILQGQRNFFFDNRSMTASEGDLILIDSNLIHTTRSVSEGDLGHNRITREVIDQIVKNQLIQSSTLVKVQYKHFNDYNLFAVCTRGCLFHINRFNIIVAVFWNIFITNEMIEMRIV